MKLRLRSTASKDTLKIGVPSDCTLRQLKQVIADRIGGASSSITVSLNRKDELIGAPDEPLNSLGVASGDLLFYTTDFTVFLPKTLTLGAESSGSSHGVAETASFEVGTIDCGNAEAVDKAKAVEGAAEVRLGESEVERTRFGDEEMVDVKVDETLEIEQSGVGVDDVNDKMDDDVLLDVIAKRQSTPHFLKNVWKDGRGEVLSGHRLLVAAVQAVLVDSGFVRLDLKTGAPVYEFQLLDANTPPMSLRLRYTLGELIESKSMACEFVTVKMYKRGCDLVVYGDMSGNKNGCYNVKLNETCYARNMELELQKSIEGGEDSGGGAGVFLSERHDSEVFKFYKEVKDKLALPLLIDICDKAGFPQPRCLMQLPTELKLKIFEFVRGVDLAKLACLCSELQYLTSDNSLWKMKYVEEFGNSEGDNSTNWKLKFVTSWKRARVIKDKEDMYRFNRLARLNRPLRNQRPPPFGMPFIIGGDADLYPFGVVPFGGSSSRQPSFPYPSFQPSRRFSPNRNCY